MQALVHYSKNLEVMEGIGLSGREVGLNAMVGRIKGYARAAEN